MAGVGVVSARAHLMRTWWRVAWLTALIACGDNHAHHEDAGLDQSTCDPAACPSDGCHRATCLANACALIDLSHCATPVCALGGCGADRDGDALADAWETPDTSGQRYVDMDCNGSYDGPSVDVPLDDADP